jgi:hypothetical protein
MWLGLIQVIKPYTDIAFNISALKTQISENYGNV